MAFRRDQLEICLRETGTGVLIFFDARRDRMHLEAAVVQIDAADAARAAVDGEDLARAANCGKLLVNCHG